MAAKTFLLCLLALAFVSASPNNNHHCDIHRFLAGNVIQAKVGACVIVQHESEYHSRNVWYVDTKSDDTNKRSLEKIELVKGGDWENTDGERTYKHTQDFEFKFPSESVKVGDIYTVHLYKVHGDGPKGLPRPIVFEIVN